MEVFVYNKRREGVREFNSRVSEFCQEHAVIGYSAKSLGANLVLFLTLAEDTGAAQVPTIDLHVRPLEANALDLEEQLSSLLEEEMNKGTDEAQHDPINAEVVAQANDDTKGWVVVASINGVAEDDSVAKEPDEVIPPSDVGFPGT